AKMSLIVRREDTDHGKVLRRYAHLGTGNYHPATARQYTDFGLFTAHEELCADVAEVFQQLTGLGRAGRLKHVWQSPFTLHRRIELCCPVLDATLKKRVIREGLQPYLEDNTQAWVMGPDGNYERQRPRRAKARSAQEELLLLATPS